MSSLFTSIYGVLCGHCLYDRINSVVLGPSNAIPFALNNGLKMRYKVNENTLNKALKALRHYHRYSQSELANALDVPKSYISDIETGRKPATLLLVGKYSELFEIQRSDILALAEAYERKKFRKLPSSIILKVFDWIASDKTGVAESRGVSLKQRGGREHQRKNRRPAHSN